MLARLSATKDVGSWLRWDPGQAGEGGSVLGSRSGAGVSEPSRSWPERSLGCQPAAVRQPEKHRGFSEAQGAPPKQQGLSHTAWPRTKAARLLPEQERSTASKTRPGTLPRAAPGLQARSSSPEQTSEVPGMDFCCRTDYTAHQPHRDPQELSPSMRELLCQTYGCRSIHPSPEATLRQSQRAVETIRRTKRPPATS